MMFTAREIEDRDSLGFFLRSQRERRGLDLEYVARKIMVDERYLQHLEENQFEYLPGEVYCKHFLKRYVEYLGFSLQEVLQSYKQDLDAIKHWKAKTLQPRLPIAVHEFITWPKIFRAAVVSIMSLALFGYLGYSAYTFLQPPDLTVLHPVDNIVIPDDTIVVEGMTDPEAVVTINSVPIVVDDGYFSHEFDLQGGINTFEIISAKKHGRKRVLERQVIVDEDVSSLSKQ
ncbi:MAG: helix-turn-helix domain-containing protein [Patescibacteria group bacterium]